LGRFFCFYFLFIYFFLVITSVFVGDAIQKFFEKFFNFLKNKNIKKSEKKYFRKLKYFLFIMNKAYKHNKQLEIIKKHPITRNQRI